MKKNHTIIFILRILIFLLFLLSAIAKLYPIPIYGITKIFEQGQLIPMGLPESIVPYLSRFIIGIELFLAIAILQGNYLKRIILPIAILLISVFSVHLAMEVIKGDAENCGCFGELIPMTPLQALIKNIITIFVLFLIYKYSNTKNKRESFSSLLIQFLLILLLMFALLPIPTHTESQRASNFSAYVNEDVHIDEGQKILCFFDAGCDHCRAAAKSLTELSGEVTDFPFVHIIFSDSEKDKIPEFFSFAGKEYSFQVLPFYLDDDEINSYLEILGFDYENPAVIYLNNGNQLRFYDGTGANSFKKDEFKALFQ